MNSILDPRNAFFITFSSAVNKSLSLATHPRNSKSEKIHVVFEMKN